MSAGLMKAFVYQGGTTLELVDRPIPRAKPDTAVIRVEAASICGTDLRTYRNGNEKIRPGTVIGHECAGTVTEAGQAVTGFRVGDRVQIAPAIGCGECALCRDGHTNMCDSLTTVGFQYDGVFAEYLEIPAKAFAGGNVSHVLDTVTPEEAALAEPIACVLNAQSFLGIGSGDTVAVFGSGFIGCMHAEMALASGASAVLMAEVSEVRLEQAVSLIPGVQPVHSSLEDPVEAIRRLTGGRGANVAITACSVGPVQTQALEAAAKLGRVSLFGGLSGESKGFLDSNAIHYKELSIHGVHASTAAQNRQVLEEIAAKKYVPGKYLTKIYPLEDIQAAFREVLTGNILKAVVRP